MKIKMENHNLPSSFKLSILTPFHDEAEGINEYFTVIIPILESITPNWEIVCVDDGSIDQTQKLLFTYTLQDKRIKLLCLSRNFGKEAALTAALDHATGDAIIPVDADLQDPPALIQEMVAKWKEGFEVVNAVRTRRDEPCYKKLPALLYHKLLHVITNKRIPENVGDFRLIDKKVLNAIKHLREKTRYMKGVMSWVGFKTTLVQYERPHRKIGVSKFSFLSLLNHGHDGILSFSSKPLKVWLYLGLFVSITSFAYAGYLILRTIIHGVELPGYASMMIVILFMGGVQLISLGVIGEYVARIFKEVKNRPIYILDKAYGINQDENKG